MGILYLRSDEDVDGFRPLLSSLIPTTGWNQSVLAGTHRALQRAYTTGSIYQQKKPTQVVKVENTAIIPIIVRRLCDIFTVRFCGLSTFGIISLALYYSYQ